MFRQKKSTALSRCVEAETSAFLGAGFFKPTGPTKRLTTSDGVYQGGPLGPGSKMTCLCLRQPLCHLRQRAVSHSH